MTTLEFSVIAYHPDTSIMHPAIGLNSSYIMSYYSDTVINCSDIVINSTDYNII